MKKVKVEKKLDTSSYNGKSGYYRRRYQVRHQMGKEVPPELDDEVFRFSAVQLMAIMTLMDEGKIQFVK